jgi:cytochrome c2
LAAGALAAALILLAGSSLPAQDAAAFFKQNCTSCHTIGGGRVTGPDLKDVTQRKDREWLIKFINDPQGTLAGGDPYALKLQSEARGAVMSKVVGINNDLAASLLDLIEAESKLPKSQFAGLQISNRPFTPQDIQAGMNLFMGKVRLKAGGAPCVSCHSVSDLPHLGGGRLGPDLTRVFERLGGRKGLGAWLAAPPSPTMNPVFKNHPMDPEEIVPLVAYFQNTAQKGGVADTSTWMFNFLLLGLGGTIVMLILFDLIWNKRFRSVRRLLVMGFDTKRKKQ